MPTAKPRSPRLATIGALLLLVLLPVVQAASSPVQSASIAVDGVIEAQTTSVWAAWSGSGKPQVEARSAFSITVWAYDVSGPDPLSGEIVRNTTKLFDAPASLRQSATRGGYDIAVFSPAGRHAILSDSVLLTIPDAAGASTRHATPPFPSAPAATHVQWIPDSVSTLELDGDIQMRFWETDLEIKRPDGRTLTVTSGMRTDEFGHPDGSRELLVTIKTGTTLVYATSQSLQGLFTGPINGTVEGRLAQGDGIWSDAANGVAPFTDDLSLQLQRVGSLLSGQVASESLPGGPGVVATVIDPSPQAAIQEPSSPGWLWASTVALALVAGCALAMWLSRVRSDERLEQMRSATDVQEHALALRHAQRLLGTRHAAEAAATVVQATLEVRGAQAALQVLSSARIKRFLDVPLGHVFAASIRDELGDSAGALQALEDACAIDPSLRDLFGMDVGWGVQ